MLIILAVLNNKMEIMLLTSQEKDLIETIRNYKNTYPRSIQLEDYIQELLAVLMDD